MAETANKKPSKLHATLDGTTPACRLSKGQLAVTWDPMQVNCDRCEDVLLKPSSWVTLAHLKTPEAVACLVALAGALVQAEQVPMYQQLAQEVDRLESEFQQATQNAQLVGELLGVFDG